LGTDHGIESGDLAATTVGHSALAEPLKEEMLAPGRRQEPERSDSESGAKAGQIS